MSALPMPLPSLPTSEEYLSQERAAEFKSEYLEGEIVSMAGGSPEHSAIAANLIIALGSALRGKPCRVYSSDLKVATPSLGTRSTFTYPDLSVVCGEPRFRDDQRDVLVNPVLIVEVLSPSTEAQDRGKKLYAYRQIESLMDYLLVAQDEPFVDLYHRAGDHWTLQSQWGLDGSLFLPSIEETLLLSEVYDKIAFPTPAEDVEATDPRPRKE